MPNIFNRNNPQSVSHTKSKAYLDKEQVENEKWLREKFQQIIHSTTETSAMLFQQEINQVVVANNSSSTSSGEYEHQQEIGH